MPIIPTSRLVLKIELIGECKLTVTLLYLDKRFITTEKKFRYFFTGNREEFHFFSKNSFSLLNNSMKFPDDKHYERGVTTSRVFNDEVERYYYLKDMHNSLNDWNNNYHEFKCSSDHESRRQKVKFNGEFWIL